MKKVGIIGAGAIARHHALQWRKLPVRLAAYYDVAPQAAERFSQEFGGQVYTSMADLLANVDIVDICTPAFAHKECVLAAAEAGVPMVCEKPLARHLTDCEEMVAACERTGTPLFVAHVVRFFRQFAAAKAAIDAGEIGNVGVARTIRGGSFPRHAGDRGGKIYGNFELSGGVILDVSIHDIDFLRWCLGEVERVFARGLTFADEHERDHALITLRFVGGAIAHVEGSWAFPPGPFRTRLEFCGDSGMIEWDSSDPAPVREATIDPADGTVNRSSTSPLADHDDPYCAELAHFLDCIETGQPFRVTPHDALMAVKVSLAAIESVRSGQPIDIATFEEVAV